MKLKKFISEKEYGRWILAGCCVLAFYALIYQFSAVRFALNDDNSIRNSLIYSAAKPEIKEMSFMYINLLLGVPLSFLYKWIPGIPWYDLYCAGMMALSLVLIGKAVLKECFDKKISLPAAVVSLAALLLLVFAVPVQQMQFTTTAGVIGCAALVTFFCAERKADYVISWILMQLCFFQRTTVGYVILAFLAVLAAVDVLEALLKKNRKKAGALILWAALLVLAVIAADRLDVAFNQQDQESAEFEAYSDLRVRYMDYNSYAYVEQPEVFEEVGWDEELCAMVSIWYFMDERYNADNLAAILAEVDTGISEKGEAASFTQAVRLGKEVLKNREAQLLVILTAVLSLTYLIVQGKAKGRRWTTNLKVLGFLAGAVCISFLLCMRGRFPLRVFLIIFIPVCLMLAVSLIRMLPERLEDLGNVRKGVGRALFAVVICLLTVCMGRELFRAEVQEKHRLERSKAVAMREYVRAHRDNVYVYGYDLTLAEPAYYTTPENQAYNCFFWGGTSMFSKRYYEDLEKCGLTKLQSEDWFRENVYYLVEDPTMKAVLNRYLNGRFGDVGYDVVDTIGSIEVVKFYENQ